MILIIQEKYEHDEKGRKGQHFFLHPRYIKEIKDIHPGNIVITFSRDFTDGFMLTIIDESIDSEHIIELIDKVIIEEDIRYLDVKGYTLT